MRSPTLARRERHDLCDLALVLGEDAPTLCGEWTAKELVAHLLVREHSPLGALGIAVETFARLTDRAMARLGRRDFAVLVEQLREPGLTPYALWPVEVLGNTLEYLVHHEDLRRAQTDWQPRENTPADDDAIWTAIRIGGRALVRPAGVPVRIRRADTGKEVTLRGGAEPVTIIGSPTEVTLFLFGRRQLHDVTFEGPTEKVAALRRAALGF
ncbi:TIGR03085 family protein [Nocardioides psychrotolerans]|uniref:TIGR03085 family protein n=1 Tax=Nocardioides psychrotolerans TaxID=1005945 RepID=A0A1I3FL92_9ACTN|nr:TIGR03085 family metal-binding protein [Nocardioides psychrotolerans]GEP37182.1 TIGR03085 family protein [Nocardioides psychrotolerans]SFI11681.1 TIGR03085 family protein [Nocardioides psychrotolerans]